MNTIISSETAAATVEFRVGMVPSSVQAYGLGSGESVAIQKKIGEGSWIAVKSGGVALAVSPDDTAIALWAPGIYRAVKGSTSGAVTVSVSDGTDP